MPQCQRYGLFNVFCYNTWTVLFVVTVGNRMGQQLGEHQILCAPDDA